MLKGERGARLDKLKLCPLKVKYNKELEIFQQKSEGKMTKQLSKL